ncbi:MAG TPA: xanthine dehydrogenase family protein [Clostridiaceae bacterium]|nr:xanthine dehydrogenase family protein [Clostridiaceae bacterium]
MTSTVDVPVRDSKVVTQPPQRKTVAPQEAPLEPKQEAQEDVRDHLIVGHNVQKKDAYEKVIGKALFAADMKRPNMLYGGVFRSTIPAGFIDRLDISKAAAIPGVACVLTYKDIPGLNQTGIIIKDEPILVENKIRRIGDAICLVAAETQDLVDQALAAIEIEYDEIEAVLTIDRAAEPDSPKIHGDTNLHQSKHLYCGDIDAAFEKCDVIVEDTYSSGMKSHMYIEPDVGLAEYINGILTITASTQNPHFDRGEVANMLAIPHNKVNVIQAATGGGFGGKLDIGVQCHVGLLCYHTGRPVKMVRRREESTTVSSKRHPMTMHYKTGALKDGTILAMKIHMTGDTGAYASYGPAVITRAVVHATGPYYVPNVDVTAEFYYTNNPMSGAFRGFGVPQISIAHEGQMNALARELGMDPIDLRIKNAHRVGTELPTGQVLHESVGFVETLEAAREKAKEVYANDDKKPSAPNKKRGFGIGCMWYGIGNTGLPNPAGAFVEVLGDCSVNLMVGCADIGQGSTTVMAQICAEELGLKYEDINVTYAHTMVTPEGGATSASRQTFISGKATQNAANMAKQTLIAVAAEYLKVPGDRLIFKDRMIWDREDPETKMTYPMLMMEMRRTGRLALGCGSYNPKTTYLNPKDMSGIPFEIYSYATTIVDLEVNIDTYETEVRNVISVHDVGTAINPQMVEGQIEGGVVMGLGYALYEDVILTRGRIKNLNFSDYIIPASMDVPKIYPVIVESKGEAGPFGAKGVGEPALIPTIPAAADAVEDAIGIHFNDLPILYIDIAREMNRKR